MSERNTVYLVQMTKITAGIKEAENEAKDIINILAPLIKT